MKELARPRPVCNQLDRNVGGLAVHEVGVSPTQEIWVSHKNIPLTTQNEHDTIKVNTHSLN